MKFQDYRIHTNFKMPKDYKRRFLFRGESVSMEIEAEPPSTIHTTITDTGPDRGGESSKCLDWIHEAMETIRVESGYYDDK